MPNHRDATCRRKTIPCEALTGSRFFSFHMGLMYNAASKKSVNFIKAVRKTHKFGLSEDHQSCSEEVDKCVVSVLKSARRLSVNL